MAPSQQIDRAKQPTDASHGEILNEFTHLHTRVWAQPSRNRTINNQGQLRCPGSCYTNKTPRELADRRVTRRSYRVRLPCSSPTFISAVSWLA